MIVDDAFFMRTKIRNVLTKNGFEVAGEAENGKQAIRKCGELHPDVITLDYTLGDMAGIEVLREIKKYWPEIGVIMVSAMGQEVLIQEAMEVGAGAFLVKPFKDINLVEAVNRIAGITQDIDE